MIDETNNKSVRIKAELMFIQFFEKSRTPLEWFGLGPIFKDVAAELQHLLSAFG